MTSSVLARNHVRVLGEGDQTLVLGHGFGSDQTIWQGQVQAFQAHYRIVLFDHVGSGGSDLHAFSPQRYRSLYNYGDDLLEILDELDLRQVFYVGHSLGAMAGLLAAEHDPQAFARLVLIGSSPRYLNDGDYYGGFEQADLDALFHAMASNYQAWASSFAPQIIGSQNESRLAQRFAQSLAAMRPDIALSTARTAFLSDHRAVLPTIQTPTLAIQPTADPVVPLGIGEYFVAHKPNTRLNTIDADGHLPHVTHPHEVTALIRAYLLSPVSPV